MLDSISASGASLEASQHFVVRVEDTVADNRSSDEFCKGLVMDGTQGRFKMSGVQKDPNRMAACLQCLGRLGRSRFVPQKVAILHISPQLQQSYMPYIVQYLKTGKRKRALVN